jgi:hypothetical protein
MLKKARFISLEERKGLYHARFQKDNNIDVYWALQPTKLMAKGKEIILRDGRAIRQDEILVGESPLYIIELKTL